MALATVTGRPKPNSTVNILDPDGNIIGTVTADTDGDFTRNSGSATNQRRDPYGKCDRHRRQQGRRRLCQRTGHHRT